MSNQRDTIKVICRIRPENHLEIDGNYSRCVEYTDKEICVDCQADKTSNFAGRHDFTFDRVYGPDSLQKDVFEEVGAPIIEGILKGFNGTIFAYGQTGSGKTHTMEGPDHNDPVMKGMIPRMFERLFQLIDSADESVEFMVKVSFLEIYMEKIMDLLDPSKTNLTVRKDPHQGIIIKDASELYVSSDHEMLAVMQAGSKNRSIACTRMNARSSRSHSLFICSVFQKDTKTDTSKLGKFYCVDLAGSEKTMKTNATGQTLEEAKMINKSLSALGNESIGGNSLTCLIITCSLSSYNDRETLSTLRFGNRAKSIKNTPIANSQRSAKELLAELTKTNSKIDKLNEIIRSIQSDIKNFFNFESKEDKENLANIRTELQRIANAKDLDVIYAMFKAEIDIEKLEENKEEESEEVIQNKTTDETITNSNAHTTQASIDESVNITNVSSISNANLQDPTQLAQMQENAMKVFKQHLEIVKLKEELESAIKDKEELEEEISSRNKEIYEMNEKMILMEMNYANSKQQDMITIQDLKEALERQAKSDKSNYNFIKFKDCLERLKCDLELLKISEKFSKAREINHIDENQNDTSEIPKQEEAFLGDSLNENRNQSHNDSSNSYRNVSSDKLILENIQRSIDVILLIQAEIDYQEKEGYASKSANKKKTIENDADNTTMQDIDIIDGAVGENVIANQEDSFLNSMCSDVNVSKFDENTVKYSVSASILEEQENQIKELKLVIENQNKTLTKLTKSYNDLKSEKEQAQKALEELNNSSAQDLKQGNELSDGENKQNTGQDNDSKAEIVRLNEMIDHMEKEYKSEREHHLEIINNDTLKNEYYKLESNYREVSNAKDKLYKELVHSRSKVDKVTEELQHKNEKIEELDRKVSALESLNRQTNIQLNQMMSGMPMHSFGPMIGGYMFPDNLNGQLHFTSYNAVNNYSNDTHKTANESFSHFNQNKVAPPPSFFSKNVVKPIRGGGKKTVHNYDPDPYANHNSINNKEYENLNRKAVSKIDGGQMTEKMFYKPPPTINPFAPLVKSTSDQDSDKVKKLKTIKQMRRESKKAKYLNGLKQAQKLLLDESMQMDPANESINIDPGSDSDEEDNNDESILDKMLSPSRQNNKNIFQMNQKNIRGSKDIKKDVPSKTIDLVQGMNMVNQVMSVKHQVNAKEPEKQNPFKAKKTGFASTLSKAFKNLF